MVLVYVDQVLCPTLRPGDIVIIDILGSHRSDKVRLAIVTHETSTARTYVLSLTVGERMSNVAAFQLPAGASIDIKLLKAVDSDRRHVNLPRVHDLAELAELAILVEPNAQALTRSASRVGQPGEEPT